MAEVVCGTGVLSKNHDAERGVAWSSDEQFVCAASSFALFQGDREEQEEYDGAHGYSPRKCRRYTAGLMVAAHESIAGTLQNNTQRFAAVLKAVIGERRAAQGDAYLEPSFLVSLRCRAFLEKRPGTIPADFDRSVLSDSQTSSLARGLRDYLGNLAEHLST